MSLYSWRKQKEHLVYDGYRKVSRVTFELGDGREEDYDVMMDGRVVCALVLTSDQQVVLAQQYRVGPEKILLELPGGGADKDELPESAIVREVREETGYVGEVHFVGTNFHDGYSRRIRYNYVIMNAKKVTEQSQEDAKGIEVVEITIEAFRDLLRSGELTDSTTGYMGLEYLGWL